MNEVHERAQRRRLQAKKLFWFASESPMSVEIKVGWCEPTVRARNRRRLAGMPE